MSTDPRDHSGLVWTMVDSPNPTLTMSLTPADAQQRAAAVRRFADWLERASAMWPNSTVQISAQMIRDERRVRRSAMFAPEPAKPRTEPAEKPETPQIEVPPRQKDASQSKTTEPKRNGRDRQRGVAREPRRMASLL